MSGEEDKEERRGFRVTDRRRFAETGAAREEEARAPEPDRQAETPPEPPKGDPGSEPAPVTFSTFMLGLSTQALLHLGEIPNPITQAVETDLAAAKQVIDILGVLRDKTRNNLEQSEERLLDSILYDLRMRYVELMRSGKKERR